jgi:hypothetical protein
MTDYINEQIYYLIRICKLNFWKTKKNLTKLGIRLDKKVLLTRIKTLNDRI